MHFDELRPRRHLVMPTKPEPSWASGHHADTDGATDRRMESVSGNQPFRADPGCSDAVGVLVDTGDARRDPFGVLFFGARCQRGVQSGTSHTATEAAAERRFDSALLIEIGDTPQRH